MTRAERELVIATAQALAALMAAREHGTTFSDKVTGQPTSGWEIANILIDKVDAVRRESQT